MWFRLLNARDQLLIPDPVFCLHTTLFSALLFTFCLIHRCICPCIRSFILIYIHHFVHIQSRSVIKDIVHRMFSVLQNIRVQFHIYIHMYMYTYVQHLWSPSLSLQDAYSLRQCWIQYPTVISFILTLTHI